jgi:hypothetical protein
LVIGPLFLEMLPALAAAPAPRWVSCCRQVLSSQFAFAAPQIPGTWPNEWLCMSRTILSANHEKSHANYCRAGCRNWSLCWAKKSCSPRYFAASLWNCAMRAMLVKPIEH